MSALSSATRVCVLHREVIDGGRISILYLAMQSLSCCLDSPLPRCTAPCPIEGAEWASDHSAASLCHELTWLSYGVDCGTTRLSDNLDH